MTTETEIIKRKVVADGTLSFYLEKPEGFIFKAGQSVDMTLLNPPETDAEGNTRAFSIASAPYEADLMFTTRLRDSAFKRVIQKEDERAKIKIDGPFGSFVLQNNTERPAVFLMGGIGVTPARSMILQATHDGLPHKIFLFYSNRRPEDTAFLEEFIEVEKKNSNFKLIATMTDMDKSKISWAGEGGYINVEMLKKYLADITKPIYYTSGPLAMVNAMREMLNNAGIDDDNIRSEEFSGY